MAWDDGAAAFNDGEPLYSLAHHLSRARFARFGSGRALLAGGVMGMRGGRGEGARRPDGGYMVTSQVRGCAADASH